MNATFNKDERHLFAGVPHMIGSAMAMAGKSGFIGTGKEMFASARSVLAGRGHRIEAVSAWCVRKYGLIGYGLGEHSSAT